MARKFENIEIGDQLELPLSRGSVLIYGGRKDHDPNQVCRVAIVTHIWNDPVERKDFVALAYLQRGGVYGKPVEKRTITGLARCGWRKAECDWVEKLETMEASKDTVVSIFGKRST